MREMRLRGMLVLLLVTSTAVTLGSVGVAILLVHLPQIEDENEAAANRAVTELTDRVEILLGGLEDQLRVLGLMVEAASPSQLSDGLDAAVSSGPAFDAIYVVDAGATVSAAGVEAAQRHRRAELFGSDLSANRLFLETEVSDQAVWSGKYLSALSGRVTLGVGVHIGDRVLIGEVSLEYLLRTVNVAGTQFDLPVWVVDSRGELVADTATPDNVGLLNLRGLDVVRAALDGEPLPTTFVHDGQRFYPAVAHSEAVDWYFFVRMPAGFDNPRIRQSTLLVVTAFAGSLLMGLALAPLWAARMARPLQRLMRRARAIADGSRETDWPRGGITEFNELADDLRTMAHAIGEREQTFRAIFDDSPLPLSVCDADQDMRLLEVNDAWVKTFGHPRDVALEQPATEPSLWLNQGERERVHRALREGQSRVEADLRHRDGILIDCELSAREVGAGDKTLMIIVTEDVTERHRMQRELRELNARLEARVIERTAELARINSELSSTVKDLGHAQDELVRAEKLAALGSLVAGIAHELSTPLGNGLMAATALQDQARVFRDALADGLRRSTLEEFVSQVTEASDITVRNLHRAAELLASFKQVAVDQTSSQRRDFDLASVATEILLTLRPTIRRTSVTVDVDIDAGLQLDSYPGPLGQALTNLVTNALVHGLRGAEHGRIRIEGKRDGQRHVRIVVSDDGRGIPDDLLGRVFDPFVTTGLGEGSTGLGLHITHNVVDNVLGGSINVSNAADGGAVFEMRIPLIAPHVERIDDAASTRPGVS